MDVYVPLSIILILISLLFRQKKVSQGAFMLSMVMICLFASLRYCFGPDYFSYWDIYREIKANGLGRRAEGEPLFYIYLQSFPSYTAFIVTNSILWCLVFYLFYKKYIDGKYFWLLLIYILFTESCLIDALVAMRSGLASIIFIGAYEALSRKKRLIYLLIIGASVLIHTSTIALVPLVLLNNKKKSIFFSWIFVLVICAVAVVTTFMEHNMVMSMLAMQLSDSVETFAKYEHYLDDMSTSSSIVRHLILKIMSIIPYLFIVAGARKETDEKYLLIYKLAMLVPILGLVIGQGMMSRYFMIFNCFYIVALIRSIKYVPQLYAIVSILAVLIANVFMFYNSMGQEYNMTIWHYQTILSAPSIP
ncbi:uncharacterized protein BN459_00575 [Bacteroides sp. CAG:1060]|nr:uncharacterized protein BN459_00575 [Bacteroides sp. CAG:1060]